MLTLQVNSLVNPGNGTNVVPFDSGVCRAKNISEYTTNVPGRTLWFVTDYTSSEAEEEAVCLRAATTPSSCAAECGKIGLRCDPCAIAKVSCQDALAYALTQAGYGGGSLAFFVQLQGGAPYTGSTCAAPGVPQTGTFAGNAQFAQAFGWAQLFCEVGKAPLLLNFYDFQKNYWDSTDTTTYIDPSTLCNIPIRKSTAINSVAVVEYSGLCYCTQ